MSTSRRNKARDFFAQNRKATVLDRHVDESFGRHDMRNWCVGWVSFLACISLAACICPVTTQPTCHSTRSLVNITCRKGWETLCRELTLWSVGKGQDGMATVAYPSSQHATTAPPVSVRASIELSFFFLVKKSLFASKRKRKKPKRSGGTERTCCQKRSQPQIVKPIRHVLVSFT